MNLREMRVSLAERSLATLNHLASRRGQNAMTAHLTVGIDGEDAALFYLQRKGYTIVARRWSFGDVPGDVDLIAWDGPMLCFIEVKTRTAHDLTPAETAIDDHKRNVLRRLAPLRATASADDGTADALRCGQRLSRSRTGTRIPAL